MREPRLGEVEARLDAMVQETMTGPGPVEEWPRVSRILATRALTLFRGFRACVDVPASAAAQTLLRSLADLTLLIEWISIDPQRRLDRWEADGEDETATGIREALKLDLPSRLGLDPADAQRALEAKEARVVELRDRARLGPKTRLLPDRATMATELGVGLQRQLYTVLFRSGSGYAHTSVNSFAEVQVMGGTEGPLHDPEGARSTAAALLAYVLARVSRIGRLGIEDEYDQLRRELTGVQEATPKG